MTADLPPDVALWADGVSKRYRTREVSHARGRRRGWREVPALDGIDLRVRRGECLALVGPNGAGKTTLLRIAAGVVAPTGGRLLVRRPVVGLLGAAASFHPDLSARENAILAGAFHGVGRRDLLPRLPVLLEFAGLTEAADVPTRHHSDGMRLRLAFALALHLPHAVLLGDEALAAADEAFRRQVEDRLRQQAAGGIAVILASHDATAIEHLADRVLWLDRGRAVGEGPPDILLPAYLKAMRSGAPAGT